MDIDTQGCDNCEAGTEMCTLWISDQLTWHEIGLEVFHGMHSLNHTIWQFSFYTIRVLFALYWNHNAHIWWELSGHDWAHDRVQVYRIWTVDSYPMLAPVSDTNMWLSITVPHWWAPSVIQGWNLCCCWTFSQGWNLCCCWTFSHGWIWYCEHVYDVTNKISLH